jgi:hypothetical protein
MNVWGRIERAAGKGKGLELSHEDVEFLWMHEYVRELAELDREARVQRRRTQWREGRRRGGGRRRG